MHPSSVSKLKESINNKRRADPKSNTCQVPVKKIQSTINFMPAAASSPSLTQERVNGLVMDFIIADMQAFSVVEQQSFIDLITGLQPGRTIISRKTVIGNI